jgi:transcriptional regulator with XRE-family HTH domain
VTRDTLAAMERTGSGVGELLREWRAARRFSQLELALETGVSARHLSFVETGRSVPSREMVLRLAEQLDVPLRERNRLLLSAGYAPQYSARDLEDPALAPARRALHQVLAGHEPFPAIAFDRHWNLVASNESLGPLLEGVEAELLSPPANTLRIALSPRGMAPRILNLGEYRGHLIHQVDRQLALAPDDELIALRAELLGYPGPDPADHVPGDGAIMVELRLLTELGELAFFSTVTTFGTALDITLAELAVEAFFPADAGTAEALRGAAAAVS